mmetsp:Transcript_87489/g.265473  ORF Transcript_87489/g.265473 Transcript_87489/m.265473 type:complete len:510 (-) Transcript_87489:45-1574(-)
MFDFDDIEGEEEERQQHEADAAVQAYADVPRPLWPATMNAPPFTPCGHLPPFAKTMQLKKLVEQASKRLKGELYGLPLPATPEELQSDTFGASWLTQAFHKAGSLPLENSVKRIVSLQRFEGGGSGPKALFHVEYEKPDEMLDTRLFMKQPYPLWENQQQRFISEGQGKFGDCFGGEISFYRFLSPHVPFPVPKLYFGDLNRESTEACIINYAVEWPEEGKQQYGPYEVLPPCGKCEDYELKDPHLYYFAMVQRLGTFSGLASAGKLGPEKDKVHWWDSGPKKDVFILPGFPGIEQTTRTFIEDIAPHIWPEKVRKKTFLDTLVAQLSLVNEVTPAIAEYLYKDPLYVGLHHQNGNTDNAYFYRNADGELEAGMLDWGSTAPMSYASAFQGTFTSALGDMLAEYDDRFVRAWLDAYHATGAPTLDYEELLYRYRLATCVSVYGCCSSSMQWAKPEAKPFWAGFKTYNDEQIRANFGLKFGVSMLYNRVLLMAEHGDVYWEALKRFRRKL